MVYSGLYNYNVCIYISIYYIKLYIIYIYICCQLHQFRKTSTIPNLEKWDRDQQRLLGKHLEPVVRSENNDGNNCITNKQALSGSIGGVL